MMTTKRIVSGTILELCCQACNATFPHFLFSGEDDIETAGLCSASTCKKNEVVVAEAEPTEWSTFEQAGVLEIEKRLAQQLVRDDLRVLRLLRIEREEVVGAGMSFRDFKKSHKPAVLVYSCACCRDGESRATAEKTVDEFQASGGRIVVTGRLTL
jgi:hypothetical protein